MARSTEASLLTPPIPPHTAQAARSIDSPEGFQTTTSLDARRNALFLQRVVSRRTSQIDAGLSSDSTSTFFCIRFGRAGWLEAFQSRSHICLLQAVCVLSGARRYFRPWVRLASVYRIQEEWTVCALALLAHQNHLCISVYFSKGFSLQSFYSFGVHPDYRKKKK